MYKYAFRAILLFSFLCLTACSEDSTSSSNDQTPVQPPDQPIIEPEITSPVCNDGKLEAPEACDSALGVPATCSEWDSSKTWAEGGSPVCSSDCLSIEQGSCREVLCGDGILDAAESCDGALGVPATCSEWDDSRDWLSDGAPACRDDCSAVVSGSCKLAPRQLDIMNWNVLFEYDAWGGSAVLPRAQIFHDILAKYETRPDFISMVEASQQWHYPEVNALLEDLGYAWAETTPPNDDDTGYFMTEVIY